MEDIKEKFDTNFELKLHWIIPFTAWKVFKYGVFSGPYSPIFGLNTGKYGPEKTPYFDTFHALIAGIHVEQDIFQKTSYLP